MTTYADEDPVDVEALAGGPGEAVWVGDIGDNRTARSTITVHRLVPSPDGGGVPRTRFELRYPDRPHDAETLLVHPDTGRLLVVTKSFTRGGVVYRAPQRLDPGGVNRLERVGAVRGLLTDGTFLPDGERILLRSYGGAAVYSYPDLEQLAAFALPPQEQGEAIAVGDDGRVYVTSEGRGAEVLALDLPAVDSAGGSERGEGAAPAPPASSEASGERREPSSRYDPQPWMGLGPAGLLLAALGSAVGLGLLWWSLRAARRRSRRRR